jgi:hypothetical protein
MQLRLSKGFAERVQARYDRFRMEVGILEDKPHREARERQPGAEGFRENLSSYAGGPVRKTSRGSGGLTIAAVSAANRERLGFNYLTEPFKNRNSDIIKFSQAFFKMAAGRSGSMRRRVENLLQAIVRNPILRGEYGRQARSTTKAKGFYRPMIDTAQLFKAIRSKVSTRGRRV